MELMHAGLLVLLFCSTYSYQFRGGAGYDPSVGDPESEWEQMEKVINEEMQRAPAPEPNLWKSVPGSGSSIPEAKRVPAYMIVSAREDQKELFKPEKGVRPLPYSAKEMLLKASDTPGATGRAVLRSKLIEILCHVDRMYVRIRREVFKTRDAYKYLKLGTCPVNKGTRTHYYFLYLLKTDCGFTKESKVDERSISNVLHYKPTGPVLRELTFDIPLKCKYPRFFHSFKVGFYPKLLGGTVFKALKPKSSFNLTPQDALGKGTKTYILGQPMYFEAKGPDSTASSRDERLYVKKCFITASQDSNSTPKYTVIDNQGCMIDGKVTDQSKFLTGASKTVLRFTVGSLFFNTGSTSSVSQQLYMHCEISMGKLTPTQSSKACNYDPVTKEWKELYGDDSVCTCCKSTCFSEQPKAASRSMISSHSWKVDLSSKDQYVPADSQMKPFDGDALSLEDPQHGSAYFLNYGEHDY